MKNWDNERHEEALEKRRIKKLIAMKEKPQQENKESEQSQ